MRFWLDLGVYPDLKFTELLGNVDSCLLSNLGSSEPLPLHLLSLPLFLSLLLRGLPYYVRWRCPTWPYILPILHSFFSLLLRLGNVFTPMSKFADSFFGCSHLLPGPSSELFISVIVLLRVVTFGNFHCLTFSLLRQTVFLDASGFLGLHVWDSWHFVFVVVSLMSVLPWGWFLSIPSCEWTVLTVSLHTL